MANHVTLNARPRPESGRNAVKQVRARGCVPAVIYGSRTESANLEIEHRALEMLLSKSVGENILVDLAIDDNGKVSNQLTLIQEVQHHPLKNRILHVDFHAVSNTKKMSAEITIEPVGEAEGVKTFGGLLEQTLRSIQIRCLPKDLPEIIRVDISNLNVGESLHVRDLPLGEGVETSTDPELTVFSIAAPKVSATKQSSEEEKK